MKLPHKYIAIDIETTGLLPIEAEVIQIGAIVVNEDMTTGAEFSIYLKPQTTFRDARSMKINGISEDILDTAEDFYVGMKMFEDFCKEQTGMHCPVFMAWGAYFDVDFLEESYRRFGRVFPFSHKSVDLKSIATFEISKRNIECNMGLHTVCNVLFDTFEGTPHDALDDIKNAVRVVRSFITTHLTEHQLTNK